MLLSELIKELKLAKKELGDINVILSSDSEGNSFGSIETHSFGHYQDEGVLVIYPSDEQQNIEDLF